MSEELKSLENHQGIRNGSVAGAEAPSHFEISARSKLLQPVSVQQGMSLVHEPLDHADKLQILGRASATLAHELRNPLGSMRLFASLIKDDLKQAAIPTANIEQIEKGIERIDSIIGQVLGFARVQRGTSELLNLHSIVQEQASEFNRLYPGVNIRLILRDSPFIAGDQVLLGQLVTNLLKNSTEAMQGHGELSISDLESDADHVRLTFCDSGPGVRPEQVEKIFEPFFTTKAQGTGLGLALVREVARQHGGDVSCILSEGSGCFRVILNRASRRG